MIMASEGSSDEEDKERSRGAAREKLFLRLKRSPLKVPKLQFYSFQGMSCRDRSLRGLAAVGFLAANSNFRPNHPVALSEKTLLVGLSLVPEKLQHHRSSSERLLYRPRKSRQAELSFSCYS